MCDCYEHKCELCDTTIPMHIADFEYPRSDFKVYCGKHVKDAPEGTMIFEFLEDDKDSGIPNGYKCGILGPDTNEGNEPNVSAELIRYKK